MNLLKDRARNRYHELGYKERELTYTERLYKAGWDGLGEWTCAACGRMLGKNLNGDSPFLLAKQHADSCEVGIDS